MAHTLLGAWVPKSLSVISTDQHATLEVFKTKKFFIQSIFQQEFCVRRFSPSLLPSVHPHHSSLLSSHSHPALVSSSGSKQDNSQETNHRYGRWAHILIKKKIAHFFLDKKYCRHWFFHYFSSPCFGRWKRWKTSAAEQQIMRDAWEVILINKAIERKASKRKNSKKSRPQKWWKKKGKIVQRGWKTFSFALRFFLFTLVQFSSFTVQSFQGGGYISFYIHPR